jgi:hypothetical protein
MESTEFRRAIEAWIEKSQQSIDSLSITGLFKIGSSSEGPEKIVVSLTCGEKLGLIEGWSTGDIHYTFHDLAETKEGMVEARVVSDVDHMVSALYQYLTRFVESSTAD